MILHQTRPRSIATIKTANKRIGGHFFDASTMRLFDTYLPSQTWQGRGSSTIFITADMPDPEQTGGRHVYTIRRSLYSGAVQTEAEFGKFTKLGAAKQAAADLSASEREKW